MKKAISSIESRLADGNALTKVLGWTAVIVAVVLFLGACYSLSAWIFQSLWNFVMPSLFNLPVLGFWQSFAIVLLLGFFVRGSSSSSK